MSGMRYLAAGSLLLVCCGSCSQDAANDRSEEPGDARPYEEMIVGLWRLDSEAADAAVTFDSNGTWKVYLRVKDVRLPDVKSERVEGTWSLENDVLNFTYTESTLPRDLLPVGDARSDRILELNEETLRLEGPEGRTETYKRMR